MPLPTDVYLLGMHAWFFRSGDSVTTPGNYTVPAPVAGPASKLLRPGAGDIAWIHMGSIEEGEFEPSSTDHEAWGPNPGSLVLIKVIQTKSRLMIKFTCSELTAHHLEVYLQTLALGPASTQFNTGEGGIKLGWLKIQLYDEDNNQRLVMDTWGRLKSAGSLSMGSGLVKPQFEFERFQSTLNSGTL